MRALAYPGENPENNPLPDAIMPVYLYLMGPDSNGINGQALRAVSVTKNRRLRCTRPAVFLCAHIQIKRLTGLDHLQRSRHGRLLVLQASLQEQGICSHNFCKSLCAVQFAAPAVRRQQANNLQRFPGMLVIVLSMHLQPLHGALAPSCGNESSYTVLEQTTADHSPTAPSMA